VSLPVAQSYAYCRRVARNRARNFYYSFLLLPRAEHDAICAVYAFMRHSDDLSDDPAESPAAARAAMERWRAELAAALNGEPGEYPGWPALRDAAAHYRIPQRYLHEMIDGVTLDLAPREFRTFEELARYCYLVASTAGLTLLHVLGFESPEALVLGEKCGVAFQLTNILRDVREDAARGRVYLPSEDLARFGVRREDILAGRDSPAFRELLRFEASRARALYDESAAVVGMVRRPNRAALAALIAIYRRLLERIERSNCDVLARRIRVPAWEKLWLMGTARMFPRLR